MAGKQHNSGWQRAVASIGLISLLCFWLTAATHIHSATKNGGVRQECQLCVASTSSQADVAHSSIFGATLVAVSVLFVPQKQTPNLQDSHTFPPRSPPFFA